MHEYGLISSLLDRVEAEAREQGATRIHRLWVRIGEGAGVEIELLKTAYETFREGSLCAGAELTITPVPVRWSCPACGQAIAVGSILRCPSCELPARMTGGDEIYLDRIEMEID